MVVPGRERRQFPGNKLLDVDAYWRDVEPQEGRFDFEPLDHLALGAKLDLIDFEGGARVAGQKFYFLKNEAVLLDLALQRFALDILIEEGFTPVATPDLARLVELSNRLACPDF